MMNDEWLLISLMMMMKYLIGVVEAQRILESNFRTVNPLDEKELFANDCFCNHINEDFTYIRAYIYLNSDLWRNEACLRLRLY